MCKISTRKHTAPFVFVAQLCAFSHRRLIVYFRFVSFQFRCKLMYNLCTNKTPIEYTRLRCNECANNVIFSIDSLCVCAFDAGTLIIVVLFLRHTHTGHTIYFYYSWPVTFRVCVLSVVCVKHAN